MSDDIREELAKVIRENRSIAKIMGDGYVSVMQAGDEEIADAILASPLLDRIKREAAAEALEEFANEYQETRIRVSIASPNVGDYWAGAHIATGHAVDSLRSHAEFLRKGHE